MADGAKKSDVTTTMNATRYNIAETTWVNIIRRHGSTSYPAYTEARCLTVTLLRSFANHIGELHQFKICSSSDGKYTIKPIVDLSSTKMILDVRLYDVENFENKFETYLDIHVASEFTDSVLVQISERYDASTNYYEVISGKISDVSGEKLNMIEHTFKANSWLDGPDAWPLT